MYMFAEGLQCRPYDRTINTVKAEFRLSSTTLRTLFGSYDYAFQQLNDDIETFRRHE